MADLHDEFVAIFSGQFHESEKDKHESLTVGCNESLRGERNSRGRAEREADREEEEAKIES